MKKLRLIDKPTQTDGLMFDDLYYEMVDDDWRARAERLQARRWHLLRQAMRKYHPSMKGGTI